MKLPIYLDYAATTPVDPRVAVRMCRYLTPDGVFGNPASRSHSFGWQAEQAIEAARTQVAALVNAAPRGIIWTSGATESNNLAIKGAARCYRHKGRHIVTSKTEHRAVLDVCRHLEREEGYEVTYLDPEPSGLIDLANLAAALRNDTVLVSIMHVNNEIGVIQDIEAIGKLTRRRDILFHVDAAQSTGKVLIDLQRFEVDLMSLSAHKTYGPKGVGALFVRRKPRVRLETLIHGGGHQRGLRAGTLATHQIVGMGEAFRIAREEMVSDNRRVRMLRDRLWNGLRDLEAVYVNGDLEQRVAGNLNVSFGFIEGEALLMAMQDIAISSGSACSSDSLEPSYVLRALGRPDELAHSTIRFSIGRFTTLEEIDYTVARVRNAVVRLRELSPLWEKYKGIDWRPENGLPAQGLGSMSRTMDYSAKVLDHYENPRNVGSFDQPDPNIGTGIVGTAANGRVIKLQIKVNGQELIEDARFRTYGCGGTIAAGSLLTEWVKGKTLGEARQIKNRDIIRELALPPVKIHCAVLAEHAIKAAVDDYVAKRSKAAIV